MNNKLLLIICFTITCMAHISFAQTVTGIVRDASNNNDPMIGVTIQEKDTDKGTVTDIDGRFSITLTSANPVLIFR